MFYLGYVLHTRVIPRAVSEGTKAENPISEAFRDASEVISASGSWVF